MGKTAKRLDRMLSNLGYCSRSDVPRLIRSGLVRRIDGQALKASDKIKSDEVVFDDEALDPEERFLMLHKPVGYVCTRSASEGETVYSLLPPRYFQRNPPLACVGRLDLDTSGLLLLTDDGHFLHRLTSPRHGVEKIYEVSLEKPFENEACALFESGNLILPDDTEPLDPVLIEIKDSQHVVMTLREGRYHQVRRMWEHVGNRVITLHRRRVGNLTLDGLAEGQWRALTEAELRDLR